MNAHDGLHGPCCHDHDPGVHRREVVSALRDLNSMSLRVLQDDRL